MRPAHFALALGAIAAAAPTAAAAESIQDALGQTYRTNPDIQAARARVRQTNERVPQAYGNWKPSVSVSASTGIENQEEDQVSGLTGTATTTNETLTPDTATLQVQQPLYRGGSNFAQLNRAKRRVAAERNRMDATTQQTLLRGARAYLDVWRDQQLLEFSQGNVEALKDLLDAARKRFDRGVNTRTDVVQARSRLAGGRRQLENFRGQLRQSRAVYREVVGTRPENLEYPELIEQLPQSRSEAASMAAESSPSVQAAEQSARAAEQDIRQTAGQLLPTVSIQGNASRRTDTDQSIPRTRRASVTINVQVPLYQQGIVTSQVRQAKQTANERQLTAMSTTRQAKQRARSAWAQLEAARQRVETARVEVDTAQETLEGLREENRVGTRTVQDVLDGQRDLFQAKIALARARRDLALARFRLLESVGQLTPSRLELGVESYNPAPAYGEVRDEWWSLTAPETDVEIPAVFPFND
ncbi:TolC family outer membrane protein [Limimonas halophila]|nr:TolC family outer membrane protein [Limimonas halophila]